jgi:hypothetical protein
MPSIVAEDSESKLEIMSAIVYASWVDEAEATNLVELEAKSVVIIEEELVDYEDYLIGWVQTLIWCITYPLSSTTLMKMAKLLRWTSDPRTLSSRSPENQLKISNLDGSY